MLVGQPAPLLTHTLLLHPCPPNMPPYHTVNKEANLIPVHHAHAMVLVQQTVPAASLELDPEPIEKS